jgi:hypothetical protein
MLTVMWKHHISHIQCNINQILDAERFVSYKKFVLVVICLMPGCIMVHTVIIFSLWYTGGCVIFMWDIQASDIQYYFVLHFELLLSKTSIRPYENIHYRDVMGYANLHVSRW